MATYNSQSSTGSGSLMGGLKVASPKISRKEKEKKTDWLSLASEIVGGAAGAGLGFAAGGPVGASIGAGVGMKAGQMGGVAANKAAGLEGKVERTPYLELASAALGGALRSDGLYEGFDQAEAATEALDARMTQGGLAGTPTAAPAPTSQPSVSALGPGQVAGLTDEFIAGEQGRHYAEALRQEAAVDLSRQRLAADTVRANQELANLRNDPSRAGELSEFLSTQTPQQRREFLGGVYGGQSSTPLPPAPVNLKIYPPPEAPSSRVSFPVQAAPSLNQSSVSDLANQPVTPDADFYSPGFKENMTAMPPFGELSGTGLRRMQEGAAVSAARRGLEGSGLGKPSFQDWYRDKVNQYGSEKDAREAYKMMYGE